MKMASYINIEELMANRLRKGEREFQFWQCEIVNGQVIQRGSNCVHKIHYFSNPAMWKKALTWKNYIYQDGYFSEDSSNKSTFPIIVLQVNEAGYKGSSFDVIKQSIIDEHLKKNSVNGKPSVVIPRAVIDTSGIVRKLKLEREVIKVIEDDTYYREQLEFLKKECDSRVKGAKKVIEDQQNFVKSVEEGKITDANGSLLESRKKIIHNCHKDIDFYFQELEHLSKIKV